MPFVSLSRFCSTKVEPTQPNVGRVLTRQSGFTLLEIVLVLFLVGLMASATLILTENVEDQAKYDETKHRMDIIRKAIVGDPTRTVNGGRELSGFVFDMGRLPGCMRELLEQQDCNDPSNTLATWTRNTTTGLASGWHGPYIQVLPERNGELRFRDGYGNSDASDAQNSGWNWKLYDATDAVTTNIANAVSIRVQSSGLDASSLYPQGNIDSITKLIDPNDYQTSIQNWENLEVVFENRSTGDISIAADSLRTKLSYSQNGQVNPWPGTETERDNADYLSTTFPPRAISIRSGGNLSSVSLLASDVIAVPAGSSLSGVNLTFTANGTMSFPGGTASVIASDSVTVPASSTLSGTILTIGTNGDLDIPVTSSVALSSGLQFPENIDPVMGNYSLIVACDDVVNESAVSGQRFDGDCARYGTDASPVDYVALSQPFIFQMTARSISQLPPSPFIWVIQ